MASDGQLLLPGLDDEDAMERIAPVERIETPDTKNTNPTKDSPEVQTPQALPSLREVFRNDMFFLGDGRGKRFTKRCALTPRGSYTGQHIEVGKLTIDYEHTEIGCPTVELKPVDPNNVDSFLGARGQYCGLPGLEGYPPIYDPRIFSTVMTHVKEIYRAASLKVGSGLPEEQIRHLRGVYDQYELRKVKYKFVEVGGPDGLAGESNTTTGERSYQLVVFPLS